MADNNNFNKLNYKHFQVVTQRFKNNSYTVMFYLGIPVFDVRLGDNKPFCEYGSEYINMNPLKRKAFLWKECEGHILEALNEQDACMFANCSKKTLTRLELLEIDENWGI